MNFNDAIQVKLGNSAEIDLIKLGNGSVIYERIPLYVPPNEFKERSDIEHVKTMVNKTHTDLSFMFYRSYNLLSVTTRNWDTSNVTTMESMFEDSRIGSSGLDLSKWDTGNVTNMHSMFSGCLLTSLDIAHFDTSKVTDMSHMFTGNLFKTLDISNWDLGKVTNMGSMFYGCSNLQEIDLSNCTNSYITGMFNGCTSLLSVNLSNYNTDISFTGYNNISLFNGCEYLKTLHLDNCNKNTISLIMNAGTLPTGLVGGKTRKVYCKQTEAPDEPLLSTLLNLGWGFIYVDIPPYEVGQFANNTKITKVETMVNTSHTNLRLMFNGCTSLTTVDTTGWDTSNVTDMEGMFYNCYSLKTLDLSSFNTNNVTDMSNMFYDCYKLETLDIRNFDMSYYNIFTDNMLYRCGNLTTIRLDNCSKDTITKIITSSGFPYSSGGSSSSNKIWCKRNNAPDESLLPSGWEFIYVD